MKTEALQHIYFVDDDSRVREVVSETLEELDVKVTCFASALECLDKLESGTCDLLITDFKMPGMDGLELMRQARNIAPWMPVLVITGYGDIPLAVRSVKSGAIDFIEKPLEQETFLRKVELILEKTGSLKDFPGKPLTRTESRILKYVIDGKSNRQIAEELHRSVRTVEVHRSRIMQKFAVENLVDLIKKAAAAGLVQIPDKEQKQSSEGGTEQNKQQ